ncbi:MAG: hypothetical protein UT65_C0022G0010 [Parcubacteria group bacterium GW2011_GWF2_39_8b]|uniref:Uncharacterized protein n=2 Tax=Candidatus Zambryskiibacteriota TaxID=1817925 RepID=A0A1G2T8D7_9BACT|nr:MAG: hypothetical protein UT65_C0022G0010 [Parcubacteria group bacterium GW2011_GWF2_39_8b]KKR45646.1 MAG: hypothetical protein UT81_C0009G0015 [Parcubacteria group bacterium GW2011_GWA2_40_14]OHA93545.1 MAG: hypothetical protein A2W58_02770 [Candidatus Zambryskibacteria bacterium RIFCSPHIGHO2_02_38_10.5]OHA95276.1 MAG: hypothetical protein A3C63_02005 [Candidatus Zambryskibacteria bacterium RIFCSPHIGHO2_02_FULL_39_82]OHA99364.1 MAG: hypothetical protein A3E32_02785 [Candidatus Zambryskibact
MTHVHIKKEKAITLRKKGITYSEILKQVPVAKSTLTEWFREVKLSVSEFQRLTAKKLAASKRGGEAKHRQRLERMQKIRERALKDITHITKRELWLIGIILYWAEGSKEKEYYPGTGINFNNSDPRMIKVFIKWLMESCKVAKDIIRFEIYIHENSKNNVEKTRNYWSQVTEFPLDKFNKVYFKKTPIKTNRKNIGDLYYGLLRVKVNASSTILRQVTGWTEAIVQSIK